MKTLIVCSSFVVAVAGTGAGLAQQAAPEDWPGYNRTLTAERFSPLDEINRTNVSQLAVVCTYDTGQQTGFQTSPIVIDGVLYATTEHDTFALDAATCKERWRTSEDTGSSMLKVNRGLAFLDGRLFRGLQDGHVVAYEAETGKKIWQTRIADAKKGESVPAAPVAWSGLVFIGNAGGDNKGVKGRIYALDSSTGKIVWESRLVPGDGPMLRQASQQEDPEEAALLSWKNEQGVPITGGATWSTYTIDPEKKLLFVPAGNPAPDFTPELRPGENLYSNSVVILDMATGQIRGHAQLVEEDFHDWDVAAAPVVFRNPDGKQYLVAAPKDGYLYGFDLSSGKRLYKEPFTTIENVDAPLTAEGTRFCPGSQGGAEWNGPAYDPERNRVYIGAVDWCTTVRKAPPEKVQNQPIGQAWSGDADGGFGTFDPPEKWRGWLRAFEAQSGQEVWQFESPAPVLSGVTPTAGGLVFFGDMGGQLFALDADSGKPAWQTQMPGAVGGGIISYAANGRQHIAVAAGMTSPIWPTEQTTGKIVVLTLKQQ